MNGTEVGLDYGRMLDLLGIEAQLLIAATHDAHPDAPVWSASGRTLGQTIRHLGDLCEDALCWLGSAEVERPWELPERPELREVTSRFAVRLAGLLAEFGARPPHDPCPTWWPEQHEVRFWLRRMLHATTVHRVDVQTAAGVERTAIEPDVAADGVDEVLRVWFGYRLHALGITASHACSVGVHVAGRNWLVTADQHGTAVVGSDDVAATTPDAVVGGDAAAVYLWMWGRLPNRAVEISGDPDAVAQLWGLLQLATR
ncbi:maleylpyruvate isomerase N-terminal domain-containing protein [Saccharopolyspora hirsuta]|uniref:maleylpyruvate isomerase N-terminal domain-containing protein n=1 Tax=Saccharopolyspora hirsuta TaxID=1837 RepID=UPI001FE968AB|nr:maleylpyruvate isomerase N-terminal domain-containing protein [Saccharopolyspora hirsuta]